MRDDVCAQGGQIVTKPAGFARQDYNLILHKEGHVHFGEVVFLKAIPLSAGRKEPTDRYV